MYVYNSTSYLALLVWLFGIEYINMSQAKARIFCIIVYLIMGSFCVCC